PHPKTLGLRDEFIDSYAVFWALILIFCGRQLGATHCAAAPEHLQRPERLRGGLDWESTSRHGASPRAGKAKSWATLFARKSSGEHRGTESDRKFSKS